MLIIHHLGISQSERILWLCEELGLPYEMKKYDRDPVTRMAPADYKALHLLGTAPIITDGDIVLPESAAIMEYIIGKYGNGRLALPPSDPDYANYLFWFHFANGSVMPNEMLAMVTNRLGLGPEALDALQPLLSRADKAYAFMDHRLGAVPYLAGKEFTAADIIMFFPLSTMGVFNKRDFSGYANIIAYMQRIGARPAYQAAIAKGDPHVGVFDNVQRWWIKRD